MNSRRIYRNALSHGRIYHEIQMNAGTQFDPDITKVFLKLMDNGSLYNLEHEILHHKKTQSISLFPML